MVVVILFIWVVEQILSLAKLFKHPLTTLGTLRQK